MQDARIDATQDPVGLHPVAAGSVAHRGLVVLIASGLPSLAACASDAPPTTSVVRDSAGVTIVESHAPERIGGPDWAVALEPALDLAAMGSGEPYEFFGVRDAIRLADGSIAVGLRSGEIRFFDGAGRFVEKVGGRGEGPGEFLDITSLHAIAGDSILAFDARAGRVTVIGPERTVARIVAIPFRLPRRLAPIDASTWLVMLLSLDTDLSADGGIYRRPMPIARMSADGEANDTVHVAAGPDGVILTSGGGVADARPIFGRNSHFAVRAGRVVVGDADGMGYAVHSPAGAVERIARVPGYDLTLSDALLAGERAARLEVSSSPASRELLSLLPVPVRRPAYADLRVDGEGLVWAAAHNGEFVDQIGRQPRDWELFGPDDRWLGTVRTPARFTVLEIGDDYVLGVFRDEVDVERVQLRRLSRTE